MAYPSLLCPPAALLGLVFLLFLALLVGVLGVIDHILREHQSGDVQQSDGLQLDVQIFRFIDFVQVDADLLADGRHSAVHEDFTLVGEEVDLFVCIGTGILSVGML